MTTILTTTNSSEASTAQTTADDLWLSTAETEEITGWLLKPEGLCKGEVCVPIPPGREADFLRGDLVNVAAFWGHLKQPLAKTDNGDVWCLGESAGQRNEALQSLEAPDFTLPDFTGKLHSLTDFRRQKVLLITWASW